MVVASEDFLKRLCVAAHDRAGNMTETPQPDNLIDHYHLQYDAWNRLVKVRAADDSTLVAGYEYNGLNHRTVKEVYDSGSLDEVRYFYYNNQWQVLEERADVFGGSSSSAAGEPAVDTQYVWGLRYVDDLILRDRDTTGDGTLNERLYALQDANWNIVALAEPDGDIVQRFIYDAYGNATELDEDFTSYTGSDYSWPYLFTCQRLDEETDMMQYRNRYYHIQLGRFITRDPIEYIDGLNLYFYVNDNPNSYTDVLGFSRVPVCCTFSNGSENWSRNYWCDLSGSRVAHTCCKEKAKGWGLLKPWTEMISLKGRCPSSSKCNWYVEKSNVGQGHNKAEQCLANCAGGHWSLVSNCYGELWDGMYGPKSQKKEPWEFKDEKDYELIYYHPEGSLQYGSSKGTRCANATPDQIANCIRSKPRFKGPYVAGWNDCQTDTMEAAHGCCLMRFDDVIWV